VLNLKPNAPDGIRGLEVEGVNAAVASLHEHKVPILVGPMEMLEMTPTNRRPSKRASRVCSAR
jgi:hypothetical protein